MTDLQLVLQPVKKVYVKLELLNEAYIKESEIQGDLMDFSITISAESDIRRAASATMFVSNNAVLGNNYFGAWMDKMVQMHYGIYDPELDDIRWFLLGSYLFTASSYTIDVSNRTLSVQLADMMSSLTEQRGSQIGYMSGFETGGIIKNALDATISRFSPYKRTNICDFEDVIPYDIDVSRGSYPIQLTTSLVNLWPWYEQFYSVDGVYTVQPIPTTMQEPVVMTNDEMESIVISENGEVDYSTVKNCTEIWGKEIKANYAARNCNTENGIYVLDIPTLEKYEYGALYSFTADTNCIAGQKIKVAQVEENAIENYENALDEYERAKEEYDLEVAAAEYKEQTINKSILYEEDLGGAGDRKHFGSTYHGGITPGDRIIASLKVGAGQYCFRVYNENRDVLLEEVNNTNEDKVIHVNHIFSSQEAYFTIASLESAISTAEVRYEAVVALAEPTPPTEESTILPIVVESGAGVQRPAEAGDIEADHNYVVKYKTEKFILQGQSHIHVMCFEYNEMPNDGVIAGLKAFHGCEDIQIVVKPDSRFAVERIGVVKQVLDSGDYTNIYTTQLGIERAKYENWKTTRLQDSITVETLYVPWLDVNQKVEYSPIGMQNNDAGVFDTTTILDQMMFGGKETYQYMIREIQVSPLTGKMQMKLVRFFPLYPWTDGE